MAKVLVTGAAGFIGANVIRRLGKENHHSVVAVDRLPSDERWRHLIGEFLYDYVDADDLMDYLGASDRPEIEAIIHMGACSSTMETNAQFLMKNNYETSKLLFKWCARERIPFIYASSAATYGDGSMGYDDDEHSLDRLVPLNMYGYSKHLFDQWQLLQDHRPPQVVGLKFFNVYGPFEQHKGKMASVVLHAYEQIRSGGPVKLFRSYKDDYADGEQRRDFVSVDDVVEVISFLLNNPAFDGVYNVGTGQARTFKDLALAVFRALDLPPNIQYIEMPEQLREKYQYFTEANTQKLKASGYRKPFLSLEDGVARYIKFLIHSK